MKTFLLAALLMPAAALPATSSVFYASPAGYYKCAGYKTATCGGFESSDPAHAMAEITISVVTQSPLVLRVQAYVLGMGRGYAGWTTENGGQFTAQDADSGDTFTMSVTWVKAQHCVTTNGKPPHCTYRYLAESGTVSLP